MDLISGCDDELPFEFSFDDASLTQQAHHQDVSEVRRPRSKAISSLVKREAKKVGSRPMMI